MAKKKKRILILGAGIMQGPVIHNAKLMGLETIVIDGDPLAPLVSEADRFEQVDLKDIHTIETLAKKLKIDGGLDGVITAGTDFSASVAFAAEKLNLPGISHETALDASDKERMRKRFREAGLPSPAFMVFSGEAASIELPFPYPVVVKPVDNMGSRGCRRVENNGELRDAVETALRFSRSGRVIVEEYMEGPEFSVDALVYRGEITICGLADRHIFFPPYFIEMGHTMPSSISLKDQKSLLDLFIRGIKSLKIDNGAAKGDIKLTSKGPMIGEIAARLSGGFMSGWTYPYASGMNPAKGALYIALGKKPKGLNPGRNWTSAERAFISIPGLVRSIEGLDTARNVPGIKDLFLRTGPGNRISFPENNVSKAGNLISASADRLTAVQAAEKAVKMVLIRLAAPDMETEKFLAGPIETVRIFPPPAYVLDAGLLEQLAKIAPGTVMTAGSIGTVRAIIPFPAFTESNLTDYMGRSLKETMEAVEKLSGLELKERYGNSSGSSFEPILGREFWTALIRGGYQGAVYYLDSQSLSEGIP
ncbi:MAG: ATP-grasp domain-containing protein [Treponema sp.]|jgi:biotin carboxylase|nr:ATP-grasp domain-containing protein [Treponema sp.]